MFNAPLRLSSHAAWTFPVLSMARSTIHWAADPESSLILWLDPQVAPPSVEYAKKMSWFEFRLSGQAIAIPPELGSTFIEGIGICQAPTDCAEPGASFTWIWELQFPPRSVEYSNMMLSVLMSHQLRY